MTREQRLVFGEDPELYDRARPSYPDALVDEVVDLPGGREVRALDAGCGTGKATVMLAARGATGTGVEPDPAMAAVARRNLAPFGGWEVVEVGYEAFAGERGSFDLVTSAQAWHWMDPVQRIRQAEHLLRSGGWLALFWNKPIAEPSLVRRRLDELYATHAPEMGAGPPGAQIHDRVGDAPDPQRWAEVRTRAYAWSASYRTDEYVDLLCTSSDHRLLPPEQRDPLLAGVRAAIDEECGGRFEVTYTVALWAARRR
jgi:SAM-dependent methyltransferase